METPILRVTLEGFQATVQAALAGFSAQQNEMLQQSIVEHCTPEALKKLIDDESKRQIDIAVTDAVAGFYTYGPGRRFVIAEVRKKLAAELRIDPDANEMPDAR